MSIIEHENLTGLGLFIVVVAYLSIIFAVNRWKPELTSPVVIAGAAIISASVATYIAGSTRAANLAASEELSRTRLNVIRQLVADAEETLVVQADEYHKTAESSYKGAELALKEIFFASIVALDAIPSLEVMQSMQLNQTSDTFIEYTRAVQGAMAMRESSNYQWRHQDEFYSVRSEKQKDALNQLNIAVRNFTDADASRSELKGTVSTIVTKYYIGLDEREAMGTSQYENVLDVYISLLDPLKDAFEKHKMPASTLDINNKIVNVHVETRKLISLHVQRHETFERYAKLSEELANDFKSIGAELDAGIKLGKD